MPCRQATNAWCESHVPHLLAVAPCFFKFYWGFAIFIIRTLHSQHPAGELAADGVDVLRIQVVLDMRLDRLLEGVVEESVEKPEELESRPIIVAATTSLAEL